ncbi:phage tail tube protein [Vreelandella venusta]|uniref:phage tail tube protein n=1 Tax=Vreelandella venusta TaxID=44935 RepID=UPI003AA9C132
MADCNTIEKYLGRDTVVEFSITEPATEEDWNVLGSMRGKEWGSEWTTTDATTDDSPNLTQEELPTYKTGSISFDGVATKDTTKNVDLLEDFVNDPATNGSVTGYPHVWLRISVPRGADTLRVYQGCALLTSFQNTAPHDDVATWSLEGSSFSYTPETVSVTP